MLMLWTGRGGGAGGGDEQGGVPTPGHQPHRRRRCQPAAQRQECGRLRGFLQLPQGTSSLLWLGSVC